MALPLVAVVLAGGTGTRLYPASRSTNPKQFHSFGGDTSLLAETVDRATIADEVYVLTAPEFADDVRTHTPEAAVLTEPEPKDTGPAMVYAAYRIREQLGECVCCLLPADHHIDGDFESVIQTAADAAVETKGIVTVGIEPTRPATEYGYIEPGDSGERTGYHTVANFVEKPDTDTARQYVDSGYYWNAGIFVSTPSTLLREARDTALGPLVEALAAGDPKGGFAAIDAVSIDYAVMEQTNDAYLVPATVEWDDLGSWDSFERVLETNEDNNVIIGDALLKDTEDCVIATDSDGHVSAVGVSDLVIASYGNRTLVVPKARSQDVRTVVEQLRAQDQF